MSSFSNRIVEVLAKDRERRMTKENTVKSVTKVVVEMLMDNGQYQTLILDVAESTPGEISLHYQDRDSFPEAEIRIPIRNTQVMEGSWA